MTEKKAGVMCEKERNLRAEFEDSLIAIIKLNAWVLALVSPSETDYAIYIDAVESGKSAYYAKKSLVRKCLRGATPQEIMDISDLVKGKLVTSLFDAIEQASVGKLNALDLLL